MLQSLLEMSFVMQCTVHSIKSRCSLFTLCKLHENLMQISLQQKNVNNKLFHEIDGSNLKTSYVKTSINYPFTCDKFLCGFLLYQQELKYLHL